MMWLSSSLHSLFIVIYWQTKTCHSFAPSVVVVKNNNHFHFLPSSPTMTTATPIMRRRMLLSSLASSPDDDHNFHPPTDNHQITNNNQQLPTRRTLLSRLLTTAPSFLALAPPATAAVGTLPEYSDTNAILRGLTINVADFSQQRQMISFLEDAFDFKVLRQRRMGDVTDTWLGFGPEQLSIPSNFVLPVSSFNMYGGHSSLRIRYDAKTESPYYDGGKGDTPPGDNIAFLQVGVPQYRISQMVKNGGNVIDAFGYVNVLSPAGLPVRGIVGIHPDPMMFVAVNCLDVSQSRAFYERLGFVEQPYPYARPSKGTSPFEPPQPPDSVYLSHSPNSMGLLLLPPSRSKKIKRSITPNPVLRSLDIVYTPSSSTTTTADADLFQVTDPSGVSIAFTSVDQFEKEETVTKSNLIGV